MKRKSIAKFKRLYRIFPLLFWYKCNKCKQEFRREKGWRALDMPINLIFSSYYLCKSCAPTRDIANKYFLSGEHKKKLKKLKNWPPPPTPLPPKSVKRAEGEQPDRRRNLSRTVKSAPKKGKLSRSSVRRAVKSVIGR